MLIIGNDCVAARIYQEKHLQFNHPFQWCKLHISDLINLIYNLDTIDLYKIDLHRLSEQRLLIDSKIEPIYVHYCYRKGYTKPTREGIDILYERNDEYILQKYYQRLKRLDLSEKPIFILHEKFDPKFPAEYNIGSSDCIEFAKLETNYQRVLVVHNLDTFNKIPKNIPGLKTLFIKSEVTGDIAHELINKNYLS